MTTGVVNDRLEATVPVTLVTSEGVEIEVIAIIDTGYNGYLAVPEAFALSVGFRPLAPEMVKLGDGSEKPLRFFRGEIRWTGVTLVIPVLATHDEFLLGTALLQDLRLDAMFRTGEPVMLTP